MKRLADYRQPDWRFSYLRTKDGAEIDFLIERPGLSRVAVEVKSTSKVSALKNPEFGSFVSLVKDLKKTEGYLFSQDQIEQKIDGIWCLPWRKGFYEIGLLT
jgi:predicted AAA+ superfamily ATPase